MKRHLTSLGVGDHQDDYHDNTHTCTVSDCVKSVVVHLVKNASLILLFAT